MIDTPTALTLETSRLLLRPVHLSDEHAILELLSDERVVRYMLFPVFTPDRAASFVRRMQLAPAPGEARQIVCAIVKRSTSRVVGLCGLVLNGSQDQAEVWYLLAPSDWGHGLVTEAVRALVEHAFQDLGLHRVWASCLPANPASARVLEKLTFRREGLLRKNLRIQGIWNDSFLYALLAEDWIQSTKS